MGGITSRPPLLGTGVSDAPPTIDGEGGDTASGIKSSSQPKKHEADNHPLLPVTDLPRNLCLGGSRVVALSLPTCKV